MRKMMRRRRPHPSENRSDDEKLLNGPQLDGVANTQQDIDALFASLE